VQLNREANRLLAGILAAFLIVTLSAAYWAAIGPDTILQRDDNPRRFEAEARLIRGSIYDRNDELLAVSVQQPNRRQQRVYPHPEVSSLVGYASLRYGVGGAEAAYNTTLRGDDLPQDSTTQLISGLLHRPQTGTDIRLAVDIHVQQILTQAMRSLKGAAVVIAVPSGDILALASLPTYDPNTLDSDWEQLVNHPDNPFFNRALQGRYQPGGTLATPLMAAALLSRQAIDEIIPEATRTIQLSDVAVTCAVRLTSSSLSLREAYAFACPSPFASLAQSLGSETLEVMLQTFHYDQPAVIPGFQFTQPSGESLISTQALITINEDSLVAEALGQGALTVSPLQMAMMAAAIVNDGNAPQPNLLLAARLPGSETWLRTQTVRPTVPYSTAGTARQLQDLMREAVAFGAAANAGRAGIDIGGHASLAYSGEETQAWFIGFATLPARRGIAIAVVLEDSNDPGLAADIGGTTLAAAYQALQPGQSGN
jgi:peptidoglycan glycosyltransferase